MVFSKYIMPLFFIVLSILFFVGSIMLPDAPLGNPNAPKYFPLVISVFLFIMSVIHFIQMLMKEHKPIEDLKLLMKKRVVVLITFSIVMGIILALLFERIGFLFSMIIFNLGLLFVVNGPKKWITNISVAVIFSVVAWYLFGHLLGISLP